MNTISHFVGANQPVLLDNPNDFWLIREGGVDVFAVRIDEYWDSKRYHLLRVPTNCAIFGVKFPTDIPIKLIGVALNDTILQKTSSSILFPISEPNSQKQNNLALDHLYLFEDWIINLTKSIAIQPTSTHKCFRIQKGKNHIETNTTTFADVENKFWLKLQTGSLSLNIQTTTIINNETGYFPSFNPLAFTALEPTDLEAISSSDWLLKHFKETDLNYFYKTIATSLWQKIIKIEQQTKSEIETQKQLEELVQQKPLSQIYSLLSPKCLAEPVFTTLEPILKAFQIIAEAQGFSITMQNIVQQHETTFANVINKTINIADQLSIRIRQIKLTDNWWQTDSGYILGFRQDNNHACIFKPLTNSTYEAFDIQDKISTKITNYNAKQFLPDAFVIYKPCNEKKLSWQNYLRKGLFGTRKIIFQIILLGIFSAIVGVAIPVVNNIIFNNVIPENDFNLLYQVIIILLVSLLASNIFNIIKVIAILRFKIKTGSVLQTLIWDRILRLPISFFKQFSIGNLSFRANMIAQKFQDLNIIVINGTISIVILFVNSFLLFYFEPILALIAMGFGASVICLYLTLSFIKIRYAEKIYDFSAKTDGLTRQVISNIIKIRNNTAENRIFAKWINLFVQQVKNTISSNRIDIMSDIFQNILVASASITFFGVLITFQTNPLAGNFIAFIVAFSLWISAIFTLAALITQVMILTKIFKYMQPIFETPTEDYANKSWPGTLKGNIFIDKISFQYQKDGPVILQDLSMQIYPGDFVAIIGPSGSGKSTLLRLMLGFETANAGKILYDDLEINDIDLKTLRRQFGVVLQNSGLATATIYENIAAGNPKITIEDAWEASKFAGLDEFINHLPMKMHTLVMEAGSTFSGGQRQQLMIARAIARKTPILFFDEASSALDNRTQELVSQNLKKLNVTRIVVAHRLSTIVYADQIYVMDAGRIVQHGNYAELIQDEQGLFSELARRQLL